MLLNSSASPRPPRYCQSSRGKLRRAALVAVVEVDQKRRCALAARREVARQLRRLRLDEVRVQRELLARRVVQELRDLEMRDRRAARRRDPVADQADHDVGVEDRERHLAVRARLGDLSASSCCDRPSRAAAAAAGATDEPLAFVDGCKVLDNDDARLLEHDAGRRRGPQRRHIDLASQRCGIVA